MGFASGEDTAVPVGSSRAWNTALVGALQPAAMKPASAMTRRPTGVVRLVIGAESCPRTRERAGDRSAPSQVTNASWGSARPTAIVEGHHAIDASPSGSGEIPYRWSADSDTLSRLPAHDPLTTSVAVDSLAGSRRLQSGRKKERGDRRPYVGVRSLVEPVDRPGGRETYARSFFRCPCWCGRRSHDVGCHRAP